MAFRFWVGGSGNWDIATTTNWSATSGGASGASAPTEYDDVFFDANSFSAANQRVRVTGGAASCRSLTAIGVTNSPRIDFNSTTLEVFGSIYIDTSTFRSFGSTAGDNLYLLTQEDSTFYAPDIEFRLDFQVQAFTGKTLYLTSSIQVSRNNTVTLQSGSGGGNLDLNGYTLSCGSFTDDGGTSTGLTGSGVLTVYKTKTGATLFDIAPDSTSDFSDCTVNITGTVDTNNIDLGIDIPYGVLNLERRNSTTMTIDAATDVTIETLTIKPSTAITSSGQLKITDYTQQAGSSMTFSGTTSIVNGYTLEDSAIKFTAADCYIKNLDLGASCDFLGPDNLEIWIENLTYSGSNSSLRWIQAYSSGEPTYMRIPKNVISLDYFNVRDVIVLGDGYIYAGANSVNQGNNGNVIFSAPPTYKGKDIIYKVFSSFSGVFLGELNNVSSKFSFSNQINTAGGSTSIKVNVNPDDVLEDSLYEVDNCIKVFVKDEQAPNGRLVYAGYISKVEADYSEETASITVMPYGNKSNKLLFLTSETTGFSQTGNDGTQVFTGQTSSGYSYAYQDITPTGITSISSIVARTSIWGGGSSIRIRAKLFTSLALLKTLSSDASFATSDWITNPDIASEIRFTFSTPPTITSGTTYYVRFDAEATVPVVYPYGYFVSLLGTATSASGGYYEGTFGNWYDNVIDCYIKVFASDEDTTISYTTTEISDIFRDIVDSAIAQGSDISYTPFSIKDTGTTITHDFNTDDINAALETCRKAAPDGWYWYIDLATNIIYFLPEDDLDNITHSFKVGGSIKDVKLLKNSEDIVNTVYFTGGETAGVNLFVKYTDTDSYDEFGKKAVSVSDSRVTSTVTSAAMANNLLGKYSGINAIVEGSVIDNSTDSNGYDIESVELGVNSIIGNVAGGESWDYALIGTDSWDTNLYILGNQILQIVKYNYSVGSLEIVLNIPDNSIYNIIRDSKRGVDTLTTNNNPSAPS